MNKLHLIIEDIERIIMSEYNVIAKGYVVSASQAEIRVYSDAVSLLSIIKDKYFITDEGAFINENTHSKHYPNSKYYLCACKDINLK
jgi:hypothetical protein